MSDSPAAITVTDAAAAGRFEIRSGGDLAGFTEYLDADGQRIFYHTEIEQRFAGRGLAGRLIEAALRETVGTGKRIVPVCPFVRGYLEKHGDFADSVDAITEHSLELVHRHRG